MIFCRTELIQAILVAYSNGIDIDGICILYNMSDKDVNEIIDAYVDLFLWED